MHSLSDLKIVSPQVLRGWLRQGCNNDGKKIAVIDVRDEDFIGGHIKGCYHYPASKFIDTLPELRSKLQNDEIGAVIFHCALSQVRGPKSALKFLRFEDEQTTVRSSIIEDVWVLKGGFTKWQELYGDDSSVTEGYRKDIWSFAY